MTTPPESPSNYYSSADSENDYNYPQIKIGPIEVAVKSWLNRDRIKFVAISRAGHVIMTMSLHDFMIVCRTFAAFH